MSTKQPKPWQNRIVETGTLKPSEIIPNPDNWREHPERQQKAMTGALAELGWVQPVVINRTTGRLLDGHMRVALALRRQEEAVPVVWVELTDAEEKVALATIDPLGDLANRNEDDLYALIDQLTVGEADLAAFIGELDERDGDQADADDDDSGAGEEKPDRAAELLEKWKVKSGDVWQVGPHRIVCGDSFDAEALAALTDSKPVDLIVTDPPFAIYGSSTGVGTDVADDKMIRPFFEQLFKTARELVKPFAHIYAFCDWRSYPTLVHGARSAQLAAKNLLVWDKGNAGLGSMYANSHELVAFFVREPKQTAMTGNMATGHRQVFASNILRFNRTSGADRQHNAAKPVGLCIELVKNSSDDGARVLDLFLGSGTTIVAAHKTGRIGLGMEMEPRYVAVCLERLAALDLEPVRVKEGK